MFRACNGMKHGKSKEYQWLRAHMFVGVNTNIVAAITIPNGIAAASQFRPLIIQISEGFTIMKFL